MSRAAILPDPRNAEYVHPLSVEAYHALGEMGHLGKDTELLYGIVFTKMPKSPLHAFLLRRLIEYVRAALRPELFLMSEQPLTCGDSEPEPDIAVVAGKNSDFREHHPTTAELVIEIAVTSEEYDRHKALAYARAAVKELWIVITEQKIVEIFRQPGAEGYAEKCRESGACASTTVPSLRLDLDALFAS